MKIAPGHLAADAVRHQLRLRACARRVVSGKRTNQRLIVDETNDEPLKFSPEPEKSQPPGAVLTVRRELNSGS